MLEISNACNSNSILKAGSDKKKAIKLVIWNQPGNDVSGMMARCNKVVDTCEQVHVYAVAIKCHSLKTFNFLFCSWCDIRNILEQIPENVR